MLSTISETNKFNYSARDQKGKVAFYVLLWKRDGISLELFDDYWKDVHGPVCARLPGQYQYWQFHVAHNEGGFWPSIPGLDSTREPQDNFDGIAELTFESEAERQSWFKAAGILMDDEGNLFKKGIGYTTSSGNSITYVDAIADGTPNGETGLVKFHVLLRKASGASIESFHHFLKERFAPIVVQSDAVLKFRLHLFDEVDTSRPDAEGVNHYEAPEKQYQAAYEIAFANHLERARFFASAEYATAVKEIDQYVRQVQPFPERTAFTFVYDGQMTLAGQRGAKVANLIADVGAVNQLQEDVTSLILGEGVGHNGKAPSQNGKGEFQGEIQVSNSGLGHLLQGVQHVGVTVNNKKQSLEFYTELLGGKLVVGENDLAGDIIQNTLFQKEEIDALDQGIAPEAIDIPQLRSGKEDALDVNFISFGNTVIELIYFKDVGQSDDSYTSVKKIPSHIGHTNAMHISFNVKEGVDLNEFAKKLEEESHRRGMTNVVCNRIIRVKNETERRLVAQRYNSFKFWNEPESLAAGDPEIDWSQDPMEGWSLFYCKGPNGEQLEFNQVTRKVKTSFHDAMDQYNQANGTSFVFPDNHVDPNGKNAQGAEIPALEDRLYLKFSVPVNASFETVWEIVADKIENTSRYNPEAQDPEIVARYSDGVLRKMNALGMTVKEHIVLDKTVGTITHTLVDNSFFTGKIINEVIQPPESNSDQPVSINYTLDWKPLNEDGRKLTSQIKIRLYDAVKQAVLAAKDVAEKREAQQLKSVELQTNNTRANLMHDKLPGTNTDLVKRLFSRGEAFDSEGFITFFTDTPLYQFGNFDCCLDKATIKKSADAFFSQIDAVYHEIKMMWEVGDTVFVEMDVLYWRKDGSMVSLPCFDIFRVEGDKFSELRIFMDVNPVFNPSIPVPESASILTIAKGEHLTPPGTMRKHFAEHPEGKERVEKGFVPKWSIAGPKWPISQVDKIALCIEMETAGGSFNWDKFKTYFTDNVTFRVGASEEGQGWQVIADYLTWFYSIAEPQLPFAFRGTWDLPGVVIIEMEAKYVRRNDGKPITFPCTDILKFDDNNKIYEWRVYPDQSELWMESLKFQAK